LPKPKLKSHKGTEQKNVSQSELKFYRQQSCGPNSNKNCYADERHDTSSSYTKNMQQQQLIDRRNKQQQQQCKTHPVADSMGHIYHGYRLALHAFDLLHNSNARATSNTSNSSSSNTSSSNSCSSNTMATRNPPRVELAQ